MATNRSGAGGIAAIVPARGGSKGIPKKNIAPLGERPLIAYTIEAARSCPWIDRVIVSTDDDGIAAVAEGCGGEAPFRRPADLGGDRAAVGDAVAHALRWLDEVDRWEVRAFAVMYPSTPFRTAALVRACVEPVARGKCGSTAAVIRRVLGPESVVTLSPDGRVRPVLTEPTLAYQTTGLVSCQRARTGAVPFRAIPVEDPLLGTEIDTVGDLERAEAAIREGRWRREWLRKGEGPPSSASQRDAADPDRERALRAVRAAYEASPEPRDLHVGVVPATDLRWHQYRPARTVWTAERAVGDDPVEIAIPCNVLRGDGLVALVLRDGGGRVLATSHAWAAAHRCGPSTCPARARVGPAGGADPSILPTAARPAGAVSASVAVSAPCAEAESDRLIPLSLPGVIRYDPGRREWLDEAGGGRAIRGRQDAPEILAIDPSLAAGTPDQMRAWPELLKQGRLRGVRIPNLAAAPGSPLSSPPPPGAP